MPSKYGQESIAKATYIPPQIQQAMDRQAQSLPLHLRQYVGSDRPAYIPKGVEAQLSRQMQKNMPAHLKQYTNAYVQQNVVEPTSFRPTAPIAPHPPTPDRLRLDHSIPTGEQHTVALNSLPIASNTRFTTPDGNPQLPQNLTADPVVEDDKPKPPNYEFILNPEATTNRHNSLPSLPGFNGGLGKIAYVFGGLLILIILLNIISSLLKSPSDLPQLLSVAQDQQELIHLSSNASQYQDISLNNSNYSATAKLVITSNDNLLLQYMTNNKLKVSTKQLYLKESLSTDNAIASAESAGTFNQEFVQVNNSVLKSYMNDLSTAYNAVKGPKGRALLKNQYAQASLLQTQLNSTYQ